MPQRFYDDEEAEQILRLAAQKSPSGGMSRERLLATAAELGITAEAVEEAERQVVRENGEKTLRSAFDKHIRGEFLSHASGFFGTSVLLLVIDLFTEHRLSWSLAVIGLWGIALLFHVRETFFKGSSDYEEEYQEWLRKRYDQEEANVLVSDYLTYKPNDKLGAIKHLREHMNLSLQDAKQEVDRVMRSEHGLQVRIGIGRLKD